MDFWMAAILCGAALAGLVTLCRVAVEALLLSERTRELVVLVPLRRGSGQRSLRRAITWLEGRSGVFPGCAAGVDMGLEEQESRLCRFYCEKRGLLFLQREELASFIAKTVGKDYTGT